MKKTVYLYSLTSSQGDQSFQVVNDSGDNICIGVKQNGIYRQYDSDAAWYLEQWAALYEIKVNCKEITIEIPIEMLVSE